MKKDEKKQVKITSKLHGEFSSKVSIGSDEYLVVTESTSKSLITRAYFKGEIVSTRKYAPGVLPADLKALDKLMKEQHRIAVNALKEEKIREAKAPTEYMKEVKALLRKKSNRNALNRLREGLGQHPDNPFLLSYFGCLTAIVDKDFETGIARCQEAINTLNAKIPFGQDFFYPAFYLNLGRAYIAADGKKEAIEALKKGLKIDPEDREILTELQKLGVRRKPPVPFLERSNPINKYIGMLLHKKR